MMVGTSEAVAGEDRTLVRVRNCDDTDEHKAWVATYVLGWYL